VTGSLELLRRVEHRDLLLRRPRCVALGVEHLDRVLLDRVE